MTKLTLSGTETKPVTIQIDRVKAVRAIRDEWLKGLPAKWVGACKYLSNGFWYHCFEAAHPDYGSPDPLRPANFEETVIWHGLEALETAFKREQS